jgi:hypothetical protein
MGVRKNQKFTCYKYQELSSFEEKKIAYSFPLYFQNYLNFSFYAYLKFCTLETFTNLRYFKIL